MEDPINEIKKTVEVGHTYLCVQPSNSILILMNRNFYT